MDWLNFSSFLEFLQFFAARNCCNFEFTIQWTGTCVKQLFFSTNLTISHSKELEFSFNSKRNAIIIIGIAFLSNTHIYISNKTCNKINAVFYWIFNLPSIEINNSWFLKSKVKIKYNSASYQISGTSELFMQAKKFFYFCLFQQLKCQRNQKWFN